MSPCCIIIRSQNRQNEERILKVPRDRKQVNYRHRLLELYLTSQERVEKPERPEQMCCRL